MIFRDEYFFLSNMYPCKVTLEFEDGEYTFDNSEAGYQACKNPAVAKWFLNIDGFEAKKRGKRVKIQWHDWDTKSLEFMEYVVLQKYLQNPELLNLLVAIEGEIVEDNWWGDTTWGRFNGTGQNRLGKIHMKIRDKYKEILKNGTVFTD